VATGLPNVPAAGTLIGVSVLSGLIVTPVTIGIGYYLAVIASRFGLDPDNQGVPTIASVMDLTGVAVVLFVATSVGVLGHG
jgi:cation transporter-like permease